MDMAYPKLRRIRGVSKIKICVVVAQRQEWRNFMCFNGFGNNSGLWIILILIVLFGCCGNGNNNCGDNCGCGC